MGSVENEPQINADEHGFVALNPSPLICLWNFGIPLVFEFFMWIASSTYRRVEFYIFDVIILNDRPIAIVFQKLNIVIPASAQLRRIHNSRSRFFYDLRKTIIISISFDNLALTGY
jgi:hypothetical protein